MKLTRLTKNLYVDVCDIQLIMLVRDQSLYLRLRQSTAECPDYLIQGDDLLEGETFEDVIELIMCTQDKYYE